MMKTAILLLLSAVAAAQAAPSWLHPSNAELISAATVGYSLKNAKRPYKTIEVGVYGSGAGQNLLILSPLNCAISVGHDAATHLMRMPPLDELRSRCAGQIEVLYEVNIDGLRSDFAVAFVNARSTVRATNSAIDDDPHVVEGFLGVHYQYLNTFWFSPREVWDGKVTVEYSNGSKVSKAQVDFGKFVADELAHRTDAGTHKLLF